MMQDCAMIDCVKEKSSRIVAFIEMVWLQKEKMMKYVKRKARKVQKPKKEFVVEILVLLFALTACAATEERGREAVVEAVDMQEVQGKSNVSDNQHILIKQDVQEIQGTQEVQGTQAVQGTQQETVDGETKEDNVFDSQENEEAFGEGIGNGEQEKGVLIEAVTLSADGEGWGLSFGEEGTQPVGNASREELELFDAYFMGNAEEKVIYLTFDCGYENGNTEPILDALKKHNVQATFFVVGHFLEAAPELVVRMVEEGHTVGSHTYNHPDITTLDGPEAFQEEMDAVKEKFEEVTGRELAMYYRPPEGKCSSENLRAAKELGYSTFFWSLAYVDWDTEKQPSHKEALEKLTSRIHPGAVVLLHNTSQTNGEILDELLTEWEKLGYTVRPLDELKENEK